MTLLLTSQSGTGANFSISQLSGCTALSHLLLIHRSREYSRALPMPGLGYGNPKSPPCVRNMCAYQVFLLTSTRPPESHVLQATYTPCWPQLPCRSSHSSNSKNFSRVT